ncbi:hypothetical protein H8E77_10985 [bacterium]|nr:hypothetical protein [bacterium]
MAISRTKIKERLKIAIEDLPMNKLLQVIDFAEYLKSHGEQEATLELMNDPGMAQDVNEGQKQAAHGEGCAWREVQKEARDE